MVALTEKEQQFVDRILITAMSNCGAENPVELLDDNFSWFCYSDFKDLFSEHQYAGILSSLKEKQIVSIYDGENCLMEWYIEELPENLDFNTLVK